MRRISIVWAVFAFIVAPAHAAEFCQKPGTPLENITLVKGFYEAFNIPSKPMLDRVLADDWVDIPLAPGQGPGRDGMKGALDGFISSFPDFRVRNEDLIANGDKVVVRSTITATQHRVFAGLPATGKPLKIMAIDIHKICNGRVLQTWHVEDWLSALFQIGAMPPKL